MNALWPHQQHALDVTVRNGFASGVHAHATGTGKSILGHAIIRSFAKTHKGTLMMWLCEQASVVSEIFSRPSARKGLLVCDLVAKKPKDWCHKLSGKVSFSACALKLKNSLV